MRQAEMRERMDGSRRYTRRFRTNSRPITRGSVAFLLKRMAELSENPAAVAAIEWAAQQILEGGEEDEIVLHPKDYRKDGSK